MNVTYITGGLFNVAADCIIDSLQHSGKAVLDCDADATTANILAICTSPVPYAIVLRDARRVDLEDLKAEPRLARTLCFVAAPADPDDDLEDVLPLRAGV